MKLKVYGDVIKIKTQDLSKMELHGYFDPEKKLIVLHKDMSKQEFDETIIHELVHCIAHRLSWRQAISQQMEELICDQIAKALTENFILRGK